MENSSIDSKSWPRHCNGARCDVDDAITVEGRQHRAGQWLVVANSERGSEPADALPKRAQSVAAFTASGMDQVPVRVLNISAYLSNGCPSHQALHVNLVAAPSECTWTRPTPDFFR